MENVKIVLASASPRRQQMLSWIVPEFESIPADIDETPLPNEQPVPYCQRMARGKTLKCTGMVEGDAYFIGSDTTVCIQRQIFGKPRDKEEAFEMLKLLNGREHLVCTAVVMGCRQDGKLRFSESVSETTVRFREMSRDEIQRYVDSGDPMEKAGAYAIQNREFHPVETIRGCYAAVMGFPLCHVNVLFHQFGYDIFPQVRSACQAGTKFPCSYIPAINVSSVNISGMQGVLINP